MRVLSLIVAAFTLSNAVPVEAKSLMDDYAQEWAAREASYKQSGAESATAMKNAFDDLAEAAKKNDPTLGSKLALLLRKSQDVGYYAARQDQVERARAFLATKASVDRAQLWLQDQIESAKGLSRAADEAQEQTASMSSASPTSERLKAAGLAAFKRGAALGAFEELQTVQQNLSMYYRAKAERDARRRSAWAAALQAIGTSFQQNQAQSQREMSIRCTTISFSTNCTSN